MHWFLYGNGLRHERVKIRLLSEVKLGDNPLRVSCLLVQ